MAFKKWLGAVLAAAVMTSCGASLETTENSGAPRVTTQGNVDVPFLNWPTLIQSQAGATYADVTIYQRYGGWWSGGGFGNVFFCNRRLDPEETTSSILSACNFKNLNVKFETSNAYVSVSGYAPSGGGDTMYVYGRRNSLYTEFTATNVWFQ
ncbi:MAG: hypothetical protein HC933_04310 [Pleurocapsa sp. SU_196_0]|nr:hypothetical protein [Pleurocapsa sp. SU_196_0]